MSDSLAKKIAQAFKGTPFEGRAFLVGGCVRDSLLGLGLGSDLDIVVEGDAAGAARLLWDEGIAEIPPAIFARFGTAMVMVEGVSVEFSTARAESYDPSSRKPDVVAASLMEDCLRRDFTVNSLLQDLETGEVRDLLGSGLPDMRARILRTPKDPAATFRDDPLRMLRAVRFSCRLGFDLAPGLPEAIRQEAGRLAIVSKERIRDEVNKMLLHPSAPSAWNLMSSLGLLKLFAPEVEAMQRVDQGSYHHLDVWGHSLLTMSLVDHGDLILRWAALLHDVGKPRTREVVDGQVRFYRHEKVGEEMAWELLRRLQFSTQEAARVAKLVGSHMRLGTFDEITPAIARRLIRDLGEDLERLFDLVEADTKALRPGLQVMDVDALRKFTLSVREAEEVEQWQSPLTGRELMASLGLTPGPRLGEIKDALQEAVVEGELAPGDKEGALALAKTLLGNQEAPSS